MKLPIVGDIPPIVIVGALGLAVFALINARSIARTTVKVAADTVNNVVAGTVEGIGQTVGVPLTNQTQCQKDLAAGRRWDASFSCPAGTFLKSWF